MRILLIDDQRNFPQATRVCRTFDEGMAALREGNWDELLLDHDLGHPEPYNGYQLICWIEEQSQEHPELCPKKITLVTANPVGKKKMQMVINKLFAKN